MQIQSAPVASAMVLSTDPSSQEIVFGEDESEEEEEEEEEKRDYKTLKWGLIAICVLAIPVGIIVGWVFTRNAGGGGSEPTSSPTRITMPPTVSSNPSFRPSSIPSSEPTNLPTFGPTQQPTLSDFTILKNFLLSGQPNTFIEDDNSPQSKAIQFLLNEIDDVTEITTTNTTKQWKERYAAIVFYYTTKGPQWEHQLQFLSSNICDWNSFVSIIHQDINRDVSLFEDTIGFFCSSSRVTRIYFPVENRLNGMLMTEFGFFEELEFLQLDYADNLIGTIPSEIGALQKLTTLSLAYNDLGGELPDALMQLPNLQTLSLASLMATGNITFEENGWPKLEVAVFDDTRWKGTFPSTIGYLTSLKELSMTRTRLRGSIPTEIGLLKSLETFKLDGTCYLTTTIPTEIGELTSLRHLTFEFTSMRSGTIPTQFGNLQQLTHLDLACSRLNGTLPTEFENLNNLELFDVSKSIQLILGPTNSCHGWN